MDFSGKVALVTGASQGTGRAYALALAKEGARVVATSRSMGTPAPGEAPGKASLAETVRESEEMGCPVHAMVCDVGREDHINRAVEEIIGNYGRIDVVINNAATYPADQATPHNDPFGFSKDEWRRYMDVNVIGPYLMIKAVAPYMISQKSGAIINITSGAATHTGSRESVAHYGMLAYGVTKAALNRLSQWYGAELAPHGISVNALAPGAVVTNSWRALTDELKAQMLDTGMAKPPTVEAVGPPLVYLAQQTPETLTGRVLDADGFGKTWP